MSGADPEARVGSVIAQKYELLRLLGTGGMGAVYEALHRFTGRRVALKLMHPEFTTSGEAAARFLREARAAASVGHPGIVEVLDASQESDGTLYLALEFLQGTELSKAIDAGDLSVAQALEVTIDVLDALSAAHARGIVHRDIKPENVFIAVDNSGNRRVKVLDFGIAKQVGPDATRLGLTRTGAVLGTPYYMSPEQARGAAIDARSDLWSVGALLFRALANRVPFDADNYNALIVSIITEDAPSLGRYRPDLPHSLIDAVDKSLQRNVAQRWQSAAEMAQGLKAALGDVAPGALPLTGKKTGLTLETAGTQQWIEPAAVPSAATAPPRTSVGTSMAWDDSLRRTGAVVAPASPPKRAAGVWIGIVALLVATGGTLSVVWVRHNGEVPAGAAHVPPAPPVPALAATVIPSAPTAVVVDPVVPPVSPTVSAAPPGSEPAVDHGHGRRRHGTDPVVPAPVVSITQAPTLAVEHPAPAVAPVIPPAEAPVAPAPPVPEPPHVHAPAAAPAATEPTNDPPRTGRFAPARDFH